MTLRKWFHLFWTTLVIGIVLGLIAGLSLQLTDRDYSVPGLPAVGFNLLNMALGGATISILSQMGYFAYLIVRYIALGIIRNKVVWDMLQWALVIIVLFDLVYLRYTSSGGSLGAYFILPLVLTAVAWGTAAWKVRLTNQSGFLPTLFFMSAVTVLEAVPALRLNNPASTYFMLLPLLGCNAWQILILPRLLQGKKSKP
jgi:KinB signaling pathway activation protein